MIRIFFLCFIMALIITPLIRQLAFKVGAVDKPNYRKVHEKVMPRLGGLAIFTSFAIGMFIYQPEGPIFPSILLGCFIIVLTGVLDDLFELSPKIKLLGQLLATVPIIVSGLHIELVNIPFGGGPIVFGFLSIPITVFWIVGVTNAINLIDGLDGLAAGVSSIALITIAIMAITMGDGFTLTIALIAAGSTLGFLPYNFHPAKIFMGDAGSLFLGYIISVLALLGFKSVTVISFLIPIIILGVPITDTLFAIIRRIVKKQPISAPDKSHLHHALLRTGLSHRQAVLSIYAMATMFGVAAILFTQATTWGAVIIIIVLVLSIEIIVELTGLVSKNYKPLINIFRKGDSPPPR